MMLLITLVLIGAQTVPRPLGVEGLGVGLLLTHLRVFAGNIFLRHCEPPSGGAAIQSMARFWIASSGFALLAMTMAVATGVYR